MIIKRTFRTVDEYLAVCPEEVAAKLQELRIWIKETAPEAAELISYNMPAYKQHGILVYFAAAKKHIGFYPTASPIKAFAQELAGYKSSKGAVQFPLDRPLPKDLIQQMLRFRMDEDARKKQAGK